MHSASQVHSWVDYERSHSGRYEGCLLECDTTWSGKKSLQFCGETDCLHRKVAGSSETSHLYRTSRPHFPQDSVPHLKAVIQISRLPFIHSFVQAVGESVRQRKLVYFTPKPETL